MHRKACNKELRTSMGSVLWALGIKTARDVWREDVAVYLSELSCQDTQVFGVVPVS